MKKREARDEDKENDRERLRALTKTTYDDVWSYDGVILPEHVCGYILGVYIELNRQHRVCLIEYYRSGEKYEERNLIF